MWDFITVVDGHGSLCIAGTCEFYDVGIDFLTLDGAIFEGKYEFPEAIKNSRALLKSNHEISQVTLRFHYDLHYEGKSRELITTSGRCRG